MSSTTLIIIGEVFLVLVGIGGYLFFYLNNLNNQLFEKNQQLRDKLKDEKRHAKGLRIQIQDLNEKLQTIDKEFNQYREEHEAAAANSADIEQEYQAVQVQLAEIEAENEKLQTKVATQETQVNARVMEIDELNQKLEQLESELTTAVDESGIDYEQMYHDLRNAIAYNMSGGEDYLETLRDRLAENGNVDDARNLEELKERYNSLGEMVGIVSEVELFDDDGADEDKEALGKIDDAEGSVDYANKLLQEAKDMEGTVCNISSNQDEQIKILRADLVKSNDMNQRLRSELDRMSMQLMAFIAKAKAFQSQKDQIRMHKATHSQMHRDWVKLNTEHKTLQRKFRTLESRNEILSAQMGNRSSHDNEKVEQLADMRQKLEAKEHEMDRMIVERDMLEAQFISMSQESSLEAESSEQLKRLKQEHKLLESQFMEVLTELNNVKDPSNNGEEITHVEESSDARESAEEATTPQDKDDSDSATTVEAV